MADQQQLQQREEKFAVDFIGGCPSSIEDLDGEMPSSSCGAIQSNPEQMLYVQPQKQRL